MVSEMHSKIICLSGKAGCGKDTVAVIMKEEFENRGKTAHIINLANLLKYICAEHLGWNGEKDDVGRSLLQYVGTEIIRAQNPLFFIDFIKSLISFFGDSWDYVIIPDCRFENEVGNFRMSGFRVTHYYITRDNLVSKLSESQQMHASETEIDNVVPDFYINNNGTLDDLRDTIIRIVNESVEGFI